MHKQQVSLVPDERVDRGLTVLAELHRRQRGGGFGCNLLSLRRGERVPMRAPEPEHLVQDTRPFQRQRSGRDSLGSH